MVFYLISAVIENLEELLEENAEPDRRDGICTSNFDAPAKKALEESGHRCCVFLKTIRKRTATAVLGAIAPDHAAAEQILQRFLKNAGIQASEIRMSETTMSEMRDMLRTASRSNYVEDDDVFLDCFEIGDFLRQAPHLFAYTENLLDESGHKMQLREKARQLACEDRMLPELDRIEAGAARSGIAGHPVHCQISADNDDTCAEMTHLLLTALLRSGRIHNQRVGMLHCDGRSYHHRPYMEMAFGYCEGGALVIDLSEVSRGLGEGNVAQDSAETVVAVCDYMRKYRNSVLTVLCLPRAGAACKSLLRENLGSIPLVELEEDVLFGERSKRFLRAVARQHGVTAPYDLMLQLDDPKKGWLPKDLKAFFDRWFNDYLRGSVYPQYASFAASHQEVAKAKPVGSAYSELESMIGLSSANDVIRQALDYYKAQKIFADRGLNTGVPSLHMVFTGNPGTAKTTVARLFARIMKENGILSHGNLIEVGRGDLVGKYVGWTAQTVQQKFRAANGSVLFIDEAYSLLDGRENSFGDEAINTIVQEMENCRGETVVIFAGYPKPMEELLARNPGLRSRIAFHVPFEDYSEEELFAIAEALTAAKGLCLASGVRENLLPIIRESMRSADFGNGRFARGLVEKAVLRQASRLVRGDVLHVTDCELKTLLPEDFVISADAPKAEARVIGFSA